MHNSSMLCYYNSVMVSINVRLYICRNIRTADLTILLHESKTRQTNCRICHSLPTRLARDGLLNNQKYQSEASIFD